MHLHTEAALNSFFLNKWELSMLNVKENVYGCDKNWLNLIVVVQHEP